VLIVGCGPAGSGAAYNAAKAGLKTIIIDKKKTIGSPIECGECIDPSLLKTYGISLPPSIINAKQDGTVFTINNKILIDNHSKVWKSVTIDRQKLDKYFAYNASRAGATILAGFEAIGGDIEEGKINKVFVKTNNKTLMFEPKVVVAADGTFSTIAKLQNRPKLGKSDIGMTVSYEMTNINLKFKNRIQMFFDDICKFGYGYVIPKSKDSANVGIGMIGVEKHPWEHLQYLLDTHPIVKPQIKNSGIIEIKKGETPILGQKLQLVNENVLYVGDAAAQNLSHVGEGAIPSHICGKIAGKTVDNYINNNINLKQYPATISKTIGILFDECERIRDFVFDIWTSNLNLEFKNVLSGLLISEVMPPHEKNFLYSLEDKSTKEIIKLVTTYVREKNREKLISIKMI
jgi:geranylgeranyl reductase family protein